MGKRETVSCNQADRAFNPYFTNGICVPECIGSAKFCILTE